MGRATQGDQQLKDLHASDALRIEIKYVTKKELITLNIIEPELIKNSTRQSSAKRNTLSDSSSCEFKKKKQDTQESVAEEEAVTTAPATAVANSNGL